MNVTNYEHNLGNLRRMRVKNIKSNLWQIIYIKPDSFIRCFVIGVTSN